MPAPAGFVPLAGYTTITNSQLPGINITFTGSTYSPTALGGSLVDGRYEVNAFSAYLASAYDSLDGNEGSGVDGYGGGNFVQQSSGRTGVWRLYGDANGTTQVESADFLSFQLAFLSNSVVFDYYGNGLVDAEDFLQFRLRFLSFV